MNKTIKIFVLLLFVFSLIIFIYPEESVILKDMFKTPFVRVDKDMVVVWDQTLRKIFFYSGATFKKIAEFGGKGQGPGEFIGIEDVNIGEDYIYVSSFPKVCYFTKAGKFKSEIRNSKNAGSFKAVGSKFVGTSESFSKPTDRQFEIIYSLFNKNLDNKKDFLSLKIDKKVYFSNKEKKMKGMLIANCSKFKVFRDKIFISSTERGFYIAVYNNDGEMLYEINKDYKKRSVTLEEKRHILDALRQSIGEPEWARRKLMIIYDFPEYYPAFNNFTVKDDKIYILPFPLENKLEILILDLKGNVLKKKIIPYKMESGDIEFGRYDINNGKIYYMVENKATDEWELHIEAVE